MRNYIKSNKSKKTNLKGVQWISASDVKKRIGELLTYSKNENIKSSRIFCIRSKNTSTRAIARIYGLSRIWQKVLKETPAYIIEVVSEKYDLISEKEKDRVLLHELNHIPNNFSGSLVPHTKRGKNNFYARLKKLIEKKENVW